MQELPRHGPCFTCGSQEGGGMGVRYFEAPDGEILAKVTLTEDQQGAPGHAHGGALAAVMDEAMGWSVWLAGHRALAARLEFEYHHPTPLATPLRVKARIVSKGNRSIDTEARILLPDETVTASGKGVFVDLKDRFDQIFGGRWGVRPSPGA